MEQVSSRPVVIGIGAMKAGTTALHHRLDAHPDIRMSTPKELNFFFGTTPTDRHAGWSARGNWWRGPGWYAGHLPDDGRRGGEVSPGYTSPDHPQVAARMAAVVPDARLLYLVRDPLRRAVSQYAHHRRDGDEARPPDEALLCPGSQYVARSRYHDRLRPFLDHFPRDQVLVVFQEDLQRDRPATLARVFRHVGVDPGRDPGARGAWNRAPGPPPACRPDTAERFRALVADDVERLAHLTGPLPASWKV